MTNDQQMNADQSTGCNGNDQRQRGKRQTISGSRANGKRSAAAEQTANDQSS